MLLLQTTCRCRLQRRQQRIWTSALQIYATTMIGSMVRREERRKKEEKEKKEMALRLYLGALARWPSLSTFNAFAYPKRLAAWPLLRSSWYQRGRCWPLHLPEQ